MKTVLHKAASRGHAKHGWLDTYHTFSFADYYDTERVHFGALRVLNDDTIAPGKGFGMHPHNNMEIVTIPLEGDLEHQDSMGNKGIIRHGQVQVMSAGTGIMHSEYNASNEQEVKLLQIWVFPKKRNVEPRYDMISIGDLRKQNELFQILSPDPDDQGVWIHQDAWFNLGFLDQGWQGEYTLKVKNQGVYMFVISGELDIQGQKLAERDGMGIWETPKIEIQATKDAHILLMEVPMQ